MCHCGITAVQGIRAFMKGAKHASLFLPKLCSSVYGLYMLSVLGEWNMLHYLQFVGFHGFVDSFQPLNSPHALSMWCPTVEQAVGVGTAVLFLSHCCSFSAPSNPTLPYEQAQERGVPGDSTWPLGLGSGLYWENHSGMECRKPKSIWLLWEYPITGKERRKLNFLHASSFFYLFLTEVSFLLLHPLSTYRHL